MATRELTKRSAFTSRVSFPANFIERRIYIARGLKVMTDRDLADLYQVETKALNQAVQRNTDRFPKDFMFQLSDEEAEGLRSQIVTSKATGRGGRRYLPFVFTEHGVAMLSSVLNSKRAIRMNILIIRAFVHLRDLLATHKDLANKIEELERMQKAQGLKIDDVFDSIRRIVAPIASPRVIEPKRRIGFVAFRQ